MFVLSVCHWDDKEQPINLEVLGLRGNFETAIEDAQSWMQAKLADFPETTISTTLTNETWGEHLPRASVQLNELDGSGTVMALTVQPFVPGAEL